MLQLAGHPTVLADVEPPNQAIFAVRDPLDRFVSGFNTRLRKGYPRRLKDWSDGERLAFERFPTANSLAEALSDPQRATHAKDAMHAIAHVNKGLKTWLVSSDYVETRARDILLICWTHELDRDFERLKSAMGIAGTLALPTDEVGTHRTPDGFDRRLSPLGAENIRTWYAEDFPIYETCLALRSSMIAAL